MRTERRWFTCTNPTGSSPTPACFLWRFRASQAVANCRERLADGGESRLNAAARSTSVHISVNAGTSREMLCGGGILVEQPPEWTSSRGSSSLPGGVTRHLATQFIDAKCNAHLCSRSALSLLSSSCEVDRLLSQPRSNSVYFFEVQAKSAKANHQIKSN